MTERSNFRPDAIGDDAFRIGTAWLKGGFAPRDGQQFDAGYTRQMGGTVLYPYLQMDALYDNADRANAAYRLRKLGAGAFVAVAQVLLGPHGPRDLPRIALVAIGTATLTYLIFERYLHVFLPRGVLFF